MTELKSCPFCGSEETITTNDRQFDDVTWYATCTKCGCFIMRDLEDVVIAAWNQRAHPLPEQPQEAQIEAAAKAHCDFFGGQGWWDSGLIADTKPKALEAMRVAIAALFPPSTETKESGDA